MNDNKYYCFLVAFFILTVIFIPFFLKAENPKPCKKSLLLKQICSTIFIANALVAGLIGDFTRYAVFMFVGLCFSWLGDYLLHVRQNSGFFVAGLSSFLVGHIFYTAAYCKAFTNMFPTEPLITVPEIIMIVLLALGSVFSAIFLNKISLGKLLIPCCAYAATISVMAVKAFSLALNIIKVQSIVKVPVVTAVMLMTGATLFVVSDYTLSILTFKENVNKHGALRQVNIWTYFFAQLLLGATVFFISI